MKDIFPNKAPSNKNLCCKLAAGRYYGRAQDVQTFQKQWTTHICRVSRSRNQVTRWASAPQQSRRTWRREKQGWIVVSDRWVPGFICKLNKVAWDFAYDLSNARKCRGKLDHQGSKISSLQNRVAVLGAVAAWWDFIGKLLHQVHLVPGKASNTGAQKGGPEISTWINLARRSWEMPRNNIFANVRVFCSPQLLCNGLALQRNYHT